MEPFVMSIEQVEGLSFKEVYHLGTNERIARDLCVERYHARIKTGLPTVSIGLMREGKLVDCYHGNFWASEVHEF